MVSTQPRPESTSRTPLTSPTAPALATSEGRLRASEMPGSWSETCFWMSSTRLSLRVATAIASATVSSGKSARKPKKVTAPASRLPRSAVKCS